MAGLARLGPALPRTLSSFGPVRYLADGGMSKVSVVVGELMLVIDFSTLTQRAVLATYGENVVAEVVPTVIEDPKPSGGHWRRSWCRSGIRGRRNVTAGRWSPPASLLAQSVAAG